MLNARLGHDDDRVAMSRRLNLDTSTLETYFRCPNLGVLQIACAYLSHACELVATGARDNVYPGLCASDPLSALIKSERDISSVELTITGPLPDTVRATEYRMGIPTSKESTIRRKGKKVLSHTSRATGCHDPRPDQTSAGFARGPWRCTSRKEQGS